MNIQPARPEKAKQKAKKRCHDVLPRWSTNQMAKETKKRNHKKDRSSSDDCQAEFGLGKREISLAKTKTSQNNPKLSVVYWWLIRLIKKVRTPTVGGWYPHPHSPGGVPYVLADHGLSDLGSRWCRALLRHLYRAHFEDSRVLVEIADSLLSILETWSQGQALSPFNSCLSV